MAVDKSQVRQEERKDERLVSNSIRVSIELAEISTASGLSKEDIRKAVKQKIPSIEICYQQALDKKPNIQGRVILQLVIDSIGEVTKVTLISSKLNDKNLEQCILQKIKELTFLTPEGAQKVTVTISFDLKKC
jgi:TonB family protein